MKKKFILYGLLGLALAVAVLFSTEAALRSEHACQALEDTYLRHMLETQEQLQAISTQLAKAQVAQDVRTYVELFSAVSRQADGVASGLSVLPLSHAAMSDTIRFCNQLADYALELALLTASGGALTTEELRTLTDIHSRCMLLLGQLAIAQQEIIQLSSNGSVFYEQVSADTRPLEQLGDPDHGLDYPSMLHDGAFSNTRRTGEPRGLNSTQVDQQMAVEIARSFVGEERVKSAVPGASAGGELPCHGVTVTLNDGLILNTEVTQQGGQLLWIIPEHASFETRLTLEECTQSAQLFLQQRGYSPMEASHYQVYDGLAVIDFVAVQNEVLLYPDQVKLQIRMDTGEVVGLEANQYLMNHTRRSGLEPKLTQEQALEKIHAQLSADHVRLCVIPEGDGERLCYEVKGRFEQQVYMVYVDALTGEEADVLMMVDGANGPLAA